MKIVDAELLRGLSRQAASHPRLRANHNLHAELTDPVQRFLNAMEPGTYVRPHRHHEPRWEFFLALVGAVAVLEFDGEGHVTQRQELLAAGPVHALELAPDRWHTVACLEPGSVLFELKPGPYLPLTDKDFAAWAPQEGMCGVNAWVECFQHAQPGTCPRRELAAR